MKIRDIICEGGWDSAVTQGTVITPAIVRAALGVMQQFVNDFNRAIASKNLGEVRMGRPTGSSAHHAADAQDTPDKVYGDIDLQMIAPTIEGLTYAQFTAAWNKLADDFVRAMHPAYVHAEESKPGHPIIKVGADAYVQVDFMWHEEHMKDWGASRVTPERGIKGLLHGNLFSVLGELLDMSIQHAGVQLKKANGQHVPFSKHKDTQVITLTTNPKTFLYDIFKYEYSEITGKNASTAPADSLLLANQGNNLDNVKISVLVNGIKGLANSFEKNKMFGHGDLSRFSNAQDFLSQFLARYTEKAILDTQSKKRDKAATPDAIARAESDKEKVLSGLEMVKGLFA